MKYQTIRRSAAGKFQHRRSAVRPEAMLSLRHSGKKLKKSLQRIGFILFSVAIIGWLIFALYESGVAPESSLYNVAYSNIRNPWFIFLSH